MKVKEISEKIKILLSHLRVKFETRPNKDKDKPRATSKSEKPFSLAYQFLGGKIDHFLPLFKDMDKNLQKSGLKIGFKAYVCLTVFAALLSMLAITALTPILFVTIFNTPLLPAVLFALGGGLFALAFSIIGFYVYPIYRADKFRRELDDELPFASGYMAILSSAGVSVEKIFYSLSRLSVPMAISSEAKDIVRDVNLFGYDIISALETASKQTPSERFREMLEGIISTVHSGSNLAAYLREKSKQYMKLKRINLKKFSDTLAMLSEFYVALLLTGPLLLVIMLAVMAMLGGGGLGVLSPSLLLNLLTYMGIPLGAIVFLIILDAVSPRW